MIVVISKFHVKSEMVSSFAQAIRPMTHACRDEAHCMSHQLYQDMQNKSIWYTLGSWESPESFHEHMTSPQFQESVAKLADLLTEEPEFSFCKEVD